MKHEYSTQQIEEASDLASNGYTRIGINFLLDFLNALPEPVSDDWQECEFAEVKDTDEAVLLVFHDGAKIQGKPYLRTADQINIWVGNVSFHVSKLDTTKGKACIYRIPAPVVHPDPKMHQYILVHKFDDNSAWAFPVMGKANDEQTGYYISGLFRDPTRIVEWQQLKVAEDE